MAERRWAIPPSPLEVRENGTPIDPDVQIIDFENLQVIPVTDGHVQVTDALFGGDSPALVHYKCVRQGNCEWIQEVVFLTDGTPCLLKREIC